MAAQTDSLRKFAILATKAKMHAKAEELWQRLVDANNEDGAALYNLANAQSALGKLDAALTHYDAAIREADDAALAKACRANASCACIKAKEPERALRYCQQMDSPTSLYNLNTALRQLGRQDEAIRITWDKILQDAPPKLRDYITSRGRDRSITVVCVKWGAKYDATYVNKLARSCRRHLKGMGRLVCFTDDAAGLDDIVEARSLPITAMKAWWLKAYLFSGEADLTGPVLYLDLDTVVCGDLEELAALASGTRFATLGTAAMRNENRSGGYNSSLMAWTAPLYSEIWTLLDEDGAYEVITNCVYKFDHWLEMVVDDARLVEDGVAEYASLTGPPSSNISVVCFPLSPKPHEVSDDWVLENWV